MSGILRDYFHYSDVNPSNNSIISVRQHTVADTKNNQNEMSGSSIDFLFSD